MTKEKLWDVIVRKNPTFETAGAHFSAAGVEKFFNQVWDIAHAEGVKNGKAIAAMEHQGGLPTDEFFKMFGGKR